VVLPAEDGRRRGPPAGPALGRVEKGLLALPQQDERLPAYAPELNPVEYLWANLKDLELANLPGATLADVADAATQGIKRVCKHEDLVVGFPAHTGLTLDP
jgi:hypothetical protein